jgi:hypothetical protein
LGGFATSERGSLLKTSQTMVEQDWLIHHDNMLAHAALSVQQFLAIKNMAVAPHPHPPYSPCDFFILENKIAAKSVSFPGCL